MDNVDDKNTQCCKNCARTIRHESEPLQQNFEGSIIYCYEFCHHISEARCCFMFKEKEV